MWEAGGTPQTKQMAEDDYLADEWGGVQRVDVVAGGFRGGIH